MTRPIGNQPADLLYAGRIDNDDIEDAVIRTCEPVLEADYIPAWFPYAGTPYYEEVGMDCRYDVYLSTCETPEAVEPVVIQEIVDFDDRGFPIYEDVDGYKGIPANSGVINISVGSKALNCGSFFEDFEIAGRDITLTNKGVFDAWSAMIYDSCRLYVDDHHLELTCIDDGLKNLVLDVPF
jgi:hypothetical protein